LNDNILLRFNRAEKRAIGLTLMDFSVLVQVTNFGPRSFPLTGLKELEAEWQAFLFQGAGEQRICRITQIDPPDASQVGRATFSVFSAPSASAIQRLRRHAHHRHPGRYVLNYTRARAHHTPIAHAPARHHGRADADQRPLPDRHFAAEMRARRNM